MNEKLYMILLGCKPEGRFTEQHDIFFGIGTSLEDLVPDMLAFWPQADSKIHIDAWREVTRIDRYSVKVMPKTERRAGKDAVRLFFVNLGGYQENDFEEYHYKCVVAAKNTADAIRQAKAQTFWKHNISPHIDDKYGIDVDDIYEIEDILPAHLKEKYALVLEAATADKEDPINPGYLKLSKLVKG